MNINVNDFETAVQRIDDGFIFEKFARDFLGAYMGYEFIPVGETKDKGIDGYQYLSSRKDNNKIIYQFSTELDCKGKILDTVNKLEKNGITYTKLFYVTNRSVNNSDSITDAMLEDLGANVTIFDIRWFKGHCNETEGTIKAYKVFVDTYLHEYNTPGKFLTVANLDSDARLYVFLAQQLENGNHDTNLGDLITDTLILHGLEGTDPDQQRFKTVEEILAIVGSYLKYDAGLLKDKLLNRLSILSTKPKKIRFHSQKGYCLPFETRIEIAERNIHDTNLATTFYDDTEKVVKKYLNDTDTKVVDVQTLIINVIQLIFKKQGLEFSNLVLHQSKNATFEHNLNDTIGSAVDASSVILKNKQKVKSAMHMAIRDIVYNGTPSQLRFLRSLSNTYLMMFLLQWEPKLAVYFDTLASGLTIFVDNSVIIPALSEYYLHENNRRHWNLLKKSMEAGISMFINESLLAELVTHFKSVSSKYKSMFKDCEEVYLEDEVALLYVDEILIRSYFYAKKQQQVGCFEDFLENFIDPKLGHNTKADLIQFLDEEFGIKYISNQTLGIKIDVSDRDRLAERLSGKKSVDIKAKNDAEMILSIYLLRQKNNEDSQPSIFGFKTWWLSKDTNTYRAVVEEFGKEEYPVNCYIRPDFIYNYLALRPSKSDINDTYESIFPTMLGVNLSYHMPKEVSKAVQMKIKSFSSKKPIRMKQILRNLADSIKTDPTKYSGKKVEHFLDEQLRQYGSPTN